MSLNIYKFLKETYPFNLLPDKEIKYIENNFKLDYVEKSEIFIKEGIKADNLAIILKGSFALKKDRKIVEILEKGDVVGDTSIIFDDPMTFKVEALESSIIGLLPKEIFKELLQKHPEFKDYFTKTTIEKLAEGYKYLQPEIDDISLNLIKKLSLKPAIFCNNDDVILEVAKKMSEKNLSFCLVGNSENLEGIITDKDLKDKVLAKGENPYEVKAKNIKTYPVETISSDNFVFEAVLKMIKLNVKRLPVIENNKVIGVIEDRDIFIKQSRNILNFINQIEKENSIENLKEIYLNTQEAIANVFNTGKDIEIIQKYISEINDKLVEKAINLVLENYNNVPDFAFLVLGSEGRKEQTITTDIDNAIAFANKKDKDLILKIGEDINSILLKIGFPRCPGNIMTSNPQWVKSIDDWKAQIENWFSNSYAENIMTSSIFFDFRVVYGNKKLENELRNFIFKEIKSYRNFLVAMAMKSLEIEPPLGFFKDFIVEKSGEHKDELDIKKGGIFPITQGIRVLALENHIPDTNTIDRLRKLESKLGKNLSSELIEAFKFLQTLRLKTQIEKLKLGKLPDNYINPSNLSKMEKDLLKDSFKIIKKFQEALGIHFRIRL